jgi:hypothetical protein
MLTVVEVNAVVPGATAGDELPRRGGGGGLPEEVQCVWVAGDTTFGLTFTTLPPGGAAAMQESMQAALRGGGGRELAGVGEQAVLISDEGNAGVLALVDGLFMSLQLIGPAAGDVADALVPLAQSAAGNL